MPNNNKQIARELTYLFNEEYFPKIYHSNGEPNSETRIEVYRPISFNGLNAPILTGKRVADFSVYSNSSSEQDYIHEADIHWLDRDFSTKYAPNIMDFLINHKVNIIRISTIR